MKIKPETIERIKTQTSLHISIMTGKLEGLKSLGTSCSCNEICGIRRQNEGSICASGYCWRHIENKLKFSLKLHLERNMELLRTDLPEREIPYINDKLFRFESFGDVDNVQQVINYFRICNKNPDTQFSTWTKNLQFYREAIAIMGKPENLIIVYSSCYINKVDLEVFDQYDFVDKVFTVWDSRGECEKQGYKVNCKDKDSKDKKCVKCRNCYSKNNGVRLIHEIIK